MKNIVMRLWKEEDGQDLIEYALLVGLITLASVALFPPIGTAINGIFAKDQHLPKRRRLRIIWIWFKAWTDPLPALTAKQTEA